MNEQYFQSTRNLFISLHFFRVSSPLWTKCIRRCDFSNIEDGLFFCFFTKCPSKGDLGIESLTVTILELYKQTLLSRIPLRPLGIKSREGGFVGDVFSFIILFDTLFHPCSIGMHGVHWTWFSRWDHTCCQGPQCTKGMFEIPKLWCYDLKAMKVLFSTSMTNWNEQVTN